MVRIWFAVTFIKATAISHDIASPADERSKILIPSRPLLIWLTMRQLYFAIIATFVAIASSASSAAETSRLPNLILILADDMGYGDAGCYGSKELATPNLDALARGGLRMRDFHSSGAVCSPTRAGIMTGRYQQRAGIPMVITAAGHRNVGLALEETTLPEVLQKAGYATGLFGKWHLGYHRQFNPVHQGFSEFRGYVSGNVDYLSHLDQTGVHDWWNGERPVREEGYVTRLVNRHAVQFIDRHKDEPFFLLIAHEAVHYPYQGPGDQPERLEGEGGKYVRRPGRMDRAAAYQEMMKEMDEGIGQVMQALRQHGLEENTLVVFTSDNGPTGPGSAGTLRGRKGTLWEGGHRVPAVFHWPGKIPAGKDSDQTAISLDLFPTLLAAAGVTAPADVSLDGQNLLPVLTDGKSLGERTLYWGHGKARAVRVGPWKLIVGGRGVGQEPKLYHLADDLSEVNDLAREQPDRVKQMSKLLADWEQDVAPPKDRPGRVQN